MKNFLKSVFRILTATAIILAILAGAIYTFVPLEPEKQFTLTDGDSLVVDGSGKSLEGNLTIGQSNFETWTNADNEYTLNLTSSDIKLVDSYKFFGRKLAQVDLQNLSSVQKDSFTAKLVIDLNGSVIYQKDINVVIDNVSPTLKYIRNLKKENQQLYRVENNVYRNVKEVSTNFTFDEDVKAEFTCLNTEVDCKFENYGVSQAFVFKANPADDKLDIPIHYKVTDLAGHVLEGDLTFKFDNQMPVISMQSASYLAWGTPFYNYVFVVNSNEPLQWLEINKVRVESNNGTFSLPITGLLSGETRTINVNAFDYAGNQFFENFKVTVGEQTNEPVNCEAVAKFVCETLIGDPGYDACYQGAYADCNK
jgi:hypothetical protein